MNFLLYPSTLSWVAHLLVIGTIAIRVIMKRPATGVALAWLVLVAAVPLGGAIIYLMIGEHRIGRHRAAGIERIRQWYHGINEHAMRYGLTKVDWSRHPRSVYGMNRLGVKTVGAPTVQGSSFRLFSDTDAMFKQIIDDIDTSRTSLLMEFYIWSEGGTADEVLEAVIRAARRGVACRILVDALGGRPWWKGRQPQRLRAAGIQVQSALPVGIFRTFVGRTDLRLHRKIVVIDDRVAWTGSMNLVDPRFFKKDSGVGEWVDAMVRLEGSVVVPLAVIMISDWVLETTESLPEIVEAAGLANVRPDGPADMQVIPSGPGETGDGLLQMILALINGARDELVLTTPYLVPDDSLLRALRGASGRGVEVSLIVPEKVDSFLTRYASRSYYDDLLEADVKVFLYREGLLHTKSITVDGAVSMFGTVNLDMRSLWLNYEVALFVYEPEFARQLRALQQAYIDDSDVLTAEQWAKRSLNERVLENTLRLVGPLL